MPQYWVLNPYHAVFDRVPKITVCVNCRFKIQPNEPPPQSDISRVLLNNLHNNIRNHMNNDNIHNIQTILLAQISV